MHLAQFCHQLPGLHGAGDEYTLRMILSNVFDVNVHVVIPSPRLPSPEIEAMLHRPERPTINLGYLPQEQLYGVCSGPIVSFPLFPRPVS